MTARHHTSRCDAHVPRLRANGWRELLRSRKSARQRRCMSCSYRRRRCLEFWFQGFGLVIYWCLHVFAGLLVLILVTS